MKWLSCLVTASLSLAMFSPTASSQVEAVTATACNAGVCAPMDPATAVIVIGLAQLADELKKEKPFGKNNELVKGITTMINDLKNGLGDSNDIVKAGKNIASDLKCGPGPNNDIVKFLKNLGISISVSKNCH